MRTPTLSRSVVGLLSFAIVLLLLINVATFVMISRTANFNDDVERGQAVRLASANVLTLIVDAETSQRGYLLTGRDEYLVPYREAVTALPDQLAELRALVAGDANLEPRAARVEELSRLRLERIDMSLGLARSGRIGEAVQALRTGMGKVLMDAIRAEVHAIDDLQSSQLSFRTRRSEWAGQVTVLVNAVGAVVILVLAGISLVLVRRYVDELQFARAALDTANQQLENKVRARTAALTRANEEIQRFAYIVSHDLRAPLVNVMGYTSELEQAGKLLEREIARTEAHTKVEPEVIAAVREDMPEAIGFIRASTTKMDRLINAILKLSREGRRSLVPEILEMQPMVQAIADSLRHQTEAADAEIVVEPLPRLDSDRLAIEQIFGNLLDNAVKYLEPSRPGRIVISADTAPAGFVGYAISDNGRGVSERDSERIFELFRRAGRQDRPGEGLGLAFVRNSVRRLGGSIELESTLGEGSTFRLKFPKRLSPDMTGDLV